MSPSEKRQSISSCQLGRMKYHPHTTRCCDNATRVLVWMHDRHALQRVTASSMQGTLTRFRIGTPSDPFLSRPSHPIYTVHLCGGLLLRRLGAYGLGRTILIQDAAIDILQRHATRVSETSLCSIPPEGPRPGIDGGFPFIALWYLFARHHHSSICGGKSTSYFIFYIHPSVSTPKIAIVGLRARRG
jgi:hypothetical protein